MSRSTSNYFQSADQQERRRPKRTDQYPHRAIKLYPTFGYSRKLDQNPKQNCQYRLCRITPEHGGTAYAQWLSGADDRKISHT